MSPAQREFLTGHFFSRACVPCVNLLIVLQCRQLFLKGRKDKGLYCGTFFRRPDVLGATLLHLPGQIFALEGHM